ncbi:hypothetical protein R1flu_020653 [Riccia fluitans]|uniref:Uncharacterized protein n=1 Tax=Riccia fluitans TaxID=41844 RepID=A0ABD1ZMG8_9MARC
MQADVDEIVLTSDTAAESFNNTAVNNKLNSGWDDRQQPSRHPHNHQNPHPQQTHHPHDRQQRSSSSSSSRRKSMTTEAVASSSEPTGVYPRHHGRTLYHDTAGSRVTGHGDQFHQPVISTLRVK